MSTDIVGSKEKSQTTRGGMQDQTPSSTTAKSLSSIKDFGQPNIDVPGIDHQDTLGFVRSGPADPAHDHFANRTEGSGSPSGKVGPVTRPVTKPAAKGNAV
jgi:hypothetical protein